MIQIVIVIPSIKTSIFSAILGASISLLGLLSRSYAFLRKTIVFVKYRSKQYLSFKKTHRLYDKKRIVRALRLYYLYAIIFIFTNMIFILFIAKERSSSPVSYKVLVPLRLVPFLFFHVMR